MLALDLEEQKRLRTPSYEAYLARYVVEGLAEPSLTLTILIHDCRRVLKLPVETSTSVTSWVQVHVKTVLQKEKGDAIRNVDLRIAGGFRGTEKRRERPLHGCLARTTRLSSSQAFLSPAIRWMYRKREPR